jgi:glycosyltransferase involved in cell wall biosynthesis
VSRYPHAFQLIEKENGGHGSAWNVGLMAAKGKYLRFLDGDDWLNRESLESLVLRLEQCEADIVFSEMSFYDERNDSYQSWNQFSLPVNQLLETEHMDWCSMSETEQITGFHTSVYKTSMLQPLCPLFLEGQYYDDTILFVVPVVLATRVIYYPEIGYYYTIGRSGQTISKECMLSKYREMEKSIRKQVEFVNRYPRLSPERQRKLDQVLSTMIFKHWKCLSFLPMRESRKVLGEWNAFSRKSLPAGISSRLMKSYRILPFPVYWYLVNKFLSFN